MNYEADKWFYKTDYNNQGRYLLGTKGQKPLLCVGINPSTAEPGKLDNTLKSVQRLTLNNGYDSWIMINIYPQRATNPDDLHLEIDLEIHKKNLNEIKSILNEYQADIWAAWGTIIEKRNYLRRCLLDIYNLTLDRKCRWVSLGKESKLGHPHHPLFLNSQEKVNFFDIVKYINKVSS
ncbi:MAG: DUF1643 domain-containing protein [Bacteroidales bacterium]|nr:DUF1643 domain-containing protein [Bacteroidales bacterium]